MATTDAYSYYGGLGIAIIVGYILSSLHIERLLVAVYLLFPERVSGEFAKEKITAAEENNATDAEEDLLATRLSGWTDEHVFDLERRAIFSKASYFNVRPGENSDSLRTQTWLFVTHTSRFQKPGDYRTFELAGFSFIIILGKDKQLRAFHNVCRHRAYAVTKKECGSSTILGCRYHGWSYDTKGRLIKAPQFEQVPGFDKGKNGLWEVKAEIRDGMVFVNLDARPDPENLSLGEPELLLKGWGIGAMKCIADWKMEVSMNWKCLGSLGHGAEAEKPWWPNFLPVRFQKSNPRLEILHTVIVRRLAPGTLAVLAALPKSPNSTVIDCVVLGSKAQGLAELEALKIQISSEVDELAARSRELRGLSSPSLSAIPTGRQAQINELLNVHLDAERNLGTEIHPAARIQNFTLEGKADDDFCKELTGGVESICGANAKGLLDW